MKRSVKILILILILDYGIKFVPPTVTQLPDSIDAPVAVVLVVKLPDGKLTVIAPVAPIAPAWVVLVTLAFSIFTFEPFTWSVFVAAS